MQELKAFNEKRAEIYWWFSSLFAKELTEKELEAYHSVEISLFLAGLGENESLKLAVDSLVDALNRLQDRENAQPQLAEDFCGLFLKKEKYSALPYASIYIGESGLLNDKPAEEMAKLMEEFGVQADSKLSEPADHLAVELDFLGTMIIRSNEYEQEKHMEEAFIQQNHFIEKHLMTWLPQFSIQCQQSDDFGFYASVAQLLVAFCKLDSAYLIGE